MDSELVTAIRQVLELGFPGVMLILNWLLWRELKETRRQHIDDLREIAGMRQSLANVQSVVATHRAREPTSDIQQMRE